MQLKNRNRKKAGRRNSLGAPLEPIYEHEQADQCGAICTTPLEVYLSETIRNHAHRQEEASISKTKAESQFQIITDNPSSHPEFISKWRTTPSKILLSPSPTKASCEGRWGTGDSPPGNDSNSSINTASTSSLTVSLFDAEDDCADFFDESTMNTEEIIDQAADVVAGKYDYNTNTPVQQNINGTRRRQGRRISMPMMPVRQESIKDIDPEQQINNGMRRRQGRRSSMPMMPVRQESIKNIDPSSEVPHSNAGVKVDKFGISVPQTSSSPSTSRRKKKGRRDSLGDKPSVESQQVDKYGIPIPRPLQSSSTQASRKTGRRRQGTRSSMGDKPSTASPVDKFGIPISSPLESTSRTRRKQGRRSAMPNTLSVSFDLPPPSSQAEEVKKDDVFHQSGTVAVDKFGIPIWPKDMNDNNSKGKTGRRRNPERRASLGDAEIKDSKPNRSSRRGRRPSPPVLMTASNASAMRFFPEELQIQGRSTSAGSTTSKPEATNWAPIRPKRVPSIDKCGSQHGRTDGVSEPNAIFNIVSPKANEHNNKLDDVLKDGAAKDKPGVRGSDVSVNSMQQKDGEWWW